ncbi:MAG TPA: hypothetical protein VEC43_03055 [Candidatus Acidoferrales bacterium]|nr:hypothetical protein [Candidatus Acidoferrales bacterium]
MTEVEDLQGKLIGAEMYIDVGGKAEEFQKKIVSLLTKLGFQASLRAEGFAFFPGEELGWRRLPSIRLTRAQGVLTMMVHASDSLTALNAGAVNSTPVAVYERIMKGMMQAGKLYEEYGKKATHMSISPGLAQRNHI